MLRIGYKISVCVFAFVCCFCLFCTLPSYAKTSADVMDNTHVYQKEEKYKTVLCYQETANVYNSGCGLISINHACNFINETDKSIETMIEEIDGQTDRNNRITDVYYRRFLNSNCRFYSGAISTTPKLIAEYYGLIATRHSTPDDIDTLAQALIDGHCIWTNGIGNVFVGVDGDVKSRNGHCVMFYRYEDDLFYCHDSCEEQYTTYTKEQMKTLYECSLSKCGTWIISKDKILPDNVSKLYLDSGNGQFDVFALNPNDVSGYQVRYRISGEDEWVVETYENYEDLDINIKNLYAATIYQVQVRTFSREGIGTYYSNWSSSKTVKTKNAPCGTKVKTLINEGPKAFTITADKTPSITGYQIAYRIKGAKNWTKIRYKTTDDLEKTVSVLKANKTYHVKVRTYRTVGKKFYYSGWSGWKAIKLQNKISEEIPEEIPEDKVEDNVENLQTENEENITIENELIIQAPQ